MSRLRAAAWGVWEFVVGDDWRLAAGVVVALAVTAVVDDGAFPAWVVVPVAVALLLAASLRRATRPSS